MKLGLKAKYSPIVMKELDFLKAGVPQTIWAFFLLKDDGKSLELTKALTYFPKQTQLALMWCAGLACNLTAITVLLHAESLDRVAHDLPFDLNIAVLAVYLFWRCFRCFRKWHQLLDRDALSRCGHRMSALSLVRFFLAVIVKLLSSVRLWRLSMLHLSQDWNFGAWVQWMWNLDIPDKKPKQKPQEVGCFLWCLACIVVRSKDFIMEKILLTRHARHVESL